MKQLERNSVCSSLKIDLFMSLIVCNRTAHQWLNVFFSLVAYLSVFSNDKSPACNSGSTLAGVCLSLSSACPLYHHLAAGLTINADYSHNKLQNTGSRVSYGGKDRIAFCLILHWYYDRLYKAQLIGPVESYYHNWVLFKRLTKTKRYFFKPPGGKI